MNSFITVVETPDVPDYHRLVLRELALGSYCTYSVQQAYQNVLDTSDPEQRSRALVQGSHMSRFLLDNGADHLFCIDQGLSDRMRLVARLNRHRGTCYVTSRGRRFIQTTYADVLAVHWRPGRDDTESR